MGSRSCLGDCRDRFEGLDGPQLVCVRLRFGGVALPPLLSDFLLETLFLFLARLAPCRVEAAFAVRTATLTALVVLFVPRAGPYSFVS